MADPITITAASLVAQATQDIVGEAAKSAWAGLGHLVNLIRRKLRTTPAGEEIMARVEAEPTDLTRISDLINVLDQLVSTDPDFRKDIAKVISELSEHQATGQFVTHVYNQAQIGKVVAINAVHGNVSFL